MLDMSYEKPEDTPAWWGLGDGDQDGYRMIFARVGLWSVVVIHSP